MPNLAYTTELSLTFLSFPTIMEYFFDILIVKLAYSFLGIDQSEF
jgi:hypothetical protein